MRTRWFETGLGALFALGLASAVQASPAGMGRASLVDDGVSLVTKTHGSCRCDRGHRHVRHYRYYGPAYSYRAYRPYSYGWVDYAPRRYYYYDGPRYRTYGYGPYYGSYGYRPWYRSGSISVWW